MSQAKVTVEFLGRIELDIQGWSNGTQLEQIRKQAQDAVNNWVIMVKRGSEDPVIFPHIKKKVTEVILPIE